MVYGVYISSISYCQHLYGWIRDGIWKSWYIHSEAVTLRKLLAERNGVTSDRITQWLCLLNLPEGKRREVEALGDNWKKQVITEI